MMGEREGGREREAGREGGEGGGEGWRERKRGGMKREREGGGLNKIGGNGKEKEVALFDFVIIVITNEMMWGKIILKD